MVKVLEHHKKRVEEAVAVLGDGATPERVASYWVDKFNNLPGRRLAKKYGFDLGNTENFRQALAVEAAAVMDGSAIMIPDNELSEGGYLCQNGCPAKELQCWHKRNQAIRVNLLQMGFKSVE